MKVGPWKRLGVRELMLSKLWCWRRLLRVPWTARRSNQSILQKSTLNIHWKDWCWSSNTLATDMKNQLIGKDPDAGKDWRQKEKGPAEVDMVRQHHWLNGHEFDQTGRQWRTEEAGMLQSMGVTKTWTWFSDWSTTMGYT